MFLILSKDSVRCHKISSAKSSQFGSLVFSLDQGQAATAVADTDNDSGLDSPQKENADNDKVTIVNEDNQSDEMQEVRLNMRARNCKNMTTARPKIPLRLCKVTKV